MSWQNHTCPCSCCERKTKDEILRPHGYQWNLNLVLWSSLRLKIQMRHLITSRVRRPLFFFIVSLNVINLNLKLLDWFKPNLKEILNIQCFATCFTLINQSTYTCKRLHVQKVPGWLIIQDQHFLNSIFKRNPEVMKGEFRSRFVKRPKVPMTCFMWSFILNVKLDSNKQQKGEVPNPAKGYLCIKV